MAMTFDIPLEVQDSVANIPGLDVRVALYLRHEARLEVIRTQRHSVEARAIAERAVRKAQGSPLTEGEWESSFGELLETHQEATSGL